MKSLFEYKDYRLFIADAIDEKNIKASTVATSLDLKSKSYLGLILRGQKRLQADQIHIFKDILELSAAEFDFFFHLVFFCDAGTPQARAYHLTKLETIRKTQASSLKTQQGAEEVLAKWYYPALVLHSTMTKKLSLPLLSRALNISTDDLEESFAQLEALGFLKKAEDGQWTAQPPRIKVAKKTWSVIQRKFLKDQIRHALDTFDKNYEVKGKYYSQTITFAKGSFDEIWGLLKDKMDDLADRSDAEAPEELIQLNLQLYRII